MRISDWSSDVCSSDLGLSQVAPSLQIYSEQVNNEEYIIRGIGKANEDLATDAGVAIYLNGAYLTQSGESNAALFDIERVEVLRGPHASLYAIYAVGGVDHIIPRQPNKELDGYFLHKLGGLSADVRRIGYAWCRAGRDR